MIQRWSGEQCSVPQMVKDFMQCISSHIGRNDLPHVGQSRSMFVCSLDRRSVRTLVTCSRHTCDVFTRPFGPPVVKRAVSGADVKASTRKSARGWGRLRAKTDRPQCQAD